MALSKDKIEQLAPDQASLSAAVKLLKPANWPVTAKNCDGSLLWGECQGSGATPYRVVVSPNDVGYKCTCPSRKFPCKHSLAVMLMSCEASGRFTEAAAPDWVNDWLSRRRVKATGGPPVATDGTAKPSQSLDAAIAETLAEPETHLDPKAVARAQAQRQRIADNREAAVLEGLDDLERWIGDEFNAGLAGFAQRSATATKTLSTRLVDNKAQGLAQRLDTLAADVHRLPAQVRNERIAERLGAMQLIASAYRNQDKLPALLKCDVRRTVGWSVKREELLADPLALRVTSKWLVAANRSEVQPDKLRRLETWLLNATPEEGTPRFALLVEFVPVSAGASGLPFAVGEVLSGEVVYYPSAAPLRAVMATRMTADSATPWPDMPSGLEPALNAYEAALAALPWLEFWPLAVGGLRFAQTATGALALADAGGYVLLLDPRQAEAAMPMVGLDDIAAAFVWDGTSAMLLAADTAVGRWYEDDR
jgi:SWIM zinc finger